MKAVFGPKLPVPLSMAVATEHFVFISGQVGSLPDGTFPSSVEEQTVIIFEKIASLLKEAGASLDRVVKTTVFLTDMADFPKMNAVYAKNLSNDPPARSTIGCALVGEARVEIEAIAVR